MQNARYTVSKTKTSAFILNAFYNGTSPHRQMAVALLVKEFLIVYEIQCFITVDTRLPLHGILRQLNRVHAFALFP